MFIFRLFYLICELLSIVETARRWSQVTLLLMEETCLRPKYLVCDDSFIVRRVYYSYLQVRLFDDLFAIIQAEYTSFPVRIAQFFKNVMHGAEWKPRRELLLAKLFLINWPPSSNPKRWIQSTKSIINYSRKHTELFKSKFAFFEYLFLTGNANLLFENANVLLNHSIR